MKACLIALPILESLSDFLVKSLAVIWSYMLLDLYIQIREQYGPRNAHLRLEREQYHYHLAELYGSIVQDKVILDIFVIIKFLIILLPSIVHAVLWFDDN